MTTSAIAPPWTQLSFFGGLPGTFSAPMTQAANTDVWQHAFALLTLDRADVTSMQPGTPDALLRAGGEHALMRSVWALDVTRDAAGEILCTTPESGSSVRLNRDELVVDAHGVSSLGACPGTPVVGQLERCAARNCGTDELRGTLDGQAFTGGYGYTDFRALGVCPSGGTDTLGGCLR